MNFDPRSNVNARKVLGDELRMKSSLHHSTHSSHTTHASHATARHCWLLLGNLGDDALSGAEKGGHTRCISEGSPDHLGGVDDASGDHVGHLLVGSVKTLVSAGVHDLVHDDRSVKTGVVSDLVKGPGERVLEDRNTLLLVFIISSYASHSVQTSDESHSTAGNNSLLHCGPGGVESVSNTILLLIDLNLGSAANLEDSHTGGHPGHPLLQLLFLVLAVGVLDLIPDHVHPLADVGLSAASSQHHAVILGHHNLPNLP